MQSSRSEHFLCCVAQPTTSAAQHLLLCAMAALRTLCRLPYPRITRSVCFVAPTLKSQLQLHRQSTLKVPTPRYITTTLFDITPRIAHRAHAAYHQTQLQHAILSHNPSSFTYYTHQASRITHHASHHAPHTTHHAPRTTHHAPCTMHHAPCTMHHAPCTMHHAPCTMHHAQSIILTSVHKYSKEMRQPYPRQEQEITS
jgi:hypothetical protein